jgi:hypothetical protein
VIVGTLWPDRYDPHFRARDVLALATVISIGPAFSPAEQDRARASAARDRRLRAALDTAGYGLTQALAAAPQLVARWQDAQTADRYAWAVLTAALDVARLSAHAPLSSDMLRAAAAGTAPVSSRRRRRAPGSNRLWPTPPARCTAPPLPCVRPKLAWARSPGTSWRTT